MFYFYGSIFLDQPVLLLGSIGHYVLCVLSLSVRKRESTFLSLSYHMNRTYREIKFCLNVQWKMSPIYTILKGKNYYQFLVHSSRDIIYITHICSIYTHIHLHSYNTYKTSFCEHNVTNVIANHSTALHFIHFAIYFGNVSISVCRDLHH